jgi:hypothetical protein
LQFEQLDEPHRVARGGHQVEFTVRSREHDAGGIDVEHLDAAVRQRCQQFDDVEVVDEVVSELDHGAGQNRLSCHARPPVAGRAVVAGGADTADLSMGPTVA